VEAKRKEGTTKRR